MTKSNRATGAASAIEPRIRPPRTVEELLDRQERLASAGLNRSAARLKRDLRGVLRVDALVRRHPRLSMAAAAVLGFLAGPAMVRALFSRGGARRIGGALLRPLGRAARGAALGAIASRWTARSRV